MTLALLFGMFIACSGSNQNTGNPTHAAELPTAMTSEAPTPEPTPEPYIRLSVDNSEQGRGVAVLVNYCHPYAHTDEIMTVPIPENDYIISSRADIGLPSATFDELIIDTQKKQKATSVVVTHDMASACTIADRIAMIYEGELIAVETVENFQKLEDPRVQSFLQRMHVGREARK